MQENNETVKLIKLEEIKTVIVPAQLLMASTEQHSKEELLAESRKKVAEFKSKLHTPGNLIYDVYNNPSPKKDLLLAWAKELEVQQKLGGYEKPITEISTTIRHELKEMQMTSAIHWLKKVLPHKYKNESYIHDEDEDLGDIQYPENSSLSKEDKEYRLKQMNASYIKRLSKTIENLKNIRTNLETKVEFVPKLDQAELGKFYMHWDFANKRITEILDGRDKVLPSQQHVLFFALANATQSFTFSMFVRKIRDLAVLTPKQAGKILRGHITHVQDLFDPKNRMEACEVGFYGTQCQFCEKFDKASWRVEYKYNKDSGNYELFCHQCHTWDKIVKTEPLLVKVINEQN